MSLFSDMAEVVAESKPGYAKNYFEFPGSYICKINQFRAGKKMGGGPVFVGEFKILAVEADPLGKAHKVGEDHSYVQVFATKGAPGRVKVLLSKLFGVSADDADLKNPQAMAQILENVVEKAMFNGLVMEVRCTILPEKRDASGTVVSRSILDTSFGNLLSAEDVLKRVSPEAIQRYMTQDEIQKMDARIAQLRND